jgi:hydroxypyruvate isomerase
MLRFSACIEMIFRDRPFLERIPAVRAAGLDAIEFWGWGNKDLDAIRDRCEEHGVTVATFGHDTGGPMTAPDGLEAFLDGTRASLAAARKLGVRVLLTTVGNERPEVSRSEQHAAIVRKLKAAAPLLEEAGVTAAVEPLNLLVDHKGYYLATTEEGLEIVDEVASPYVKLLFDIYHQQITEGHVTARLTAHIAKIGHIHVADNPGRHEPGTGELNYANIFKAIAAAGYDGTIGLEYSPLAEPAVSLRRTLALALSTHD